MSKENIISLFYNGHLQVKEIAKQLDISSAYVTKIIKQDSRYIQEKNFRKSVSKNKRKIAQNEFIKKKREKQRIEDNYSYVQSQHEQATRELSKSSHLSNESYRKWNYSAYKYNPSKKRYEFDVKLGRSADVPKYIKERWKFMEEKLLKVFKLADKLRDNQSKVYAEVHYTANSQQKLELIIRSKKDFSYIEKCEINLTENAKIKWDKIITLFETFVGGATNE